MRNRREKTLSNGRATGALILGLSLIVTGCASSPAPGSNSANPSAPVTQPTDSPPTAEFSVNGYTLLAVGTRGEEKGVYKSTNATEWTFVAGYPEGINQLSSATVIPSTADKAAIRFDNEITTEASGWSTVEESSYRYVYNDLKVRPGAFADGRWWHLGAGGVWASDDAINWENTFEQTEEYVAFRLGTAAEGSLPKGDLVGNGRLMIIPEVGKIGGPHLLRANVEWEDLTVPVWTSSNGLDWERRATSIVGEAPAESADGAAGNSYLWDGKRWLWLVNNMLYAAPDAGGDLVFEKVSDVIAEGQTPTSALTSAGDFLLATANFDGLKRDDAGRALNGAVIVSTDGGQTWSLHETDVFLLSVLALPHR